MNITFPDHIITTLRSYGLSGDPEQWPFRVYSLSKERAYLMFAGGIGFLVQENNWELQNLAQCNLTEKDKEHVGARQIDLRNMPVIKMQIWLFPDGSMQWHDKEGKLHFANMADGTTPQTLTRWMQELEQKAGQLRTKLTGQKEPLNAMRDRLAMWLDYLQKNSASTPVMNGLNLDNSR